MLAAGGEAAAAVRVWGPGAQRGARERRCRGTPAKPRFRRLGDTLREREREREQRHTAAVQAIYNILYRCNISGGQGEDAHGDVDADVSFLVFGAFDLSCSASNRCM